FFTLLTILSLSFSFIFIAPLTFVIFPSSIPFCSSGVTMISSFFFKFSLFSRLVLFSIVFFTTLFIVSFISIGTENSSVIKSLAVFLIFNKLLLSIACSPFIMNNTVQSLLELYHSNIQLVPQQKTEPPLKENPVISIIIFDFG